MIRYDFVVIILGADWSNETILFVNGTDQTFYSFEHLSSSCALSIIVQAVNMIGSSPPSDPLRLEIYNKRESSTCILLVRIITVSFKD